MALTSNLICEYQKLIINNIKKPKENTKDNYVFTYFLDMVVAMEKIRQFKCKGEKNRWLDICYDSKNNLYFNNSQ